MIALDVAEINGSVLLMDLIVIALFNKITMDYNKFSIVLQNKLSVVFVIIKKQRLCYHTHVQHMSTRTRVRLYVFVVYRTDKIPYLEEGSLTLRNISGFL